MTEYILVSSGFIIPKNRWFSPIEKESSYLKQLLSREGSTTQDNQLTSLIDSNSIYSSKECNEIYLNYQHKPTFEGFMQMVDVLTEVFSEIDIGTFYDIQTRNTFLSPLGFSLLNDCTNRSFVDNYKQYAMIPSFFRMVKDTSFADMENRKKLANQTKRNSYLFNEHGNATLRFLVDLHGNRDAFATFFKYLLTDSNRGNLYA